MENFDVFVFARRPFVTLFSEASRAQQPAHTCVPPLSTHRDDDVPGEDEHDSLVVARERHGVGRADVRGGCGGRGTRRPHVVARARLSLGRDEMQERA